MKEITMATASEEAGKLVFEVLRPCCVRVMREASVESLTVLQEAVQGLPGEASIPPQLLPYLSLPLRAAIKRVGSGDVQLVESVLVTFALIFSRSQLLYDQKLFHETFTFLSMLLDQDMASKNGFVKCSEELLLACLRALKELCLCIAPSVRAWLCSHLVALGHCIFHILTLLNPAPSSPTPPSHQLRSHALLALAAVAGLNPDPILAAATPTSLPTASKEFLQLVSERVGIGGRVIRQALASFLPGVSMAITRLLATDAKTVGGVVTLGLLTWAHYVAMVMADAEEGEEPVGVDTEGNREGEHPGGVTESESRAEGGKPGGTGGDGHGNVQVVERTEDWKKKTAGNLSVLVERLCVLVTSEVWKVRLYLVCWGHTLLTHCCMSLEVCVPCFLEVLVTLTHDPYPQVAATARAALALYPGGGCGLTSLLGEQLHKLASSLPRLIRHHDDQRKVATLQLLAGYLSLAGDHVSLMLNSLPHLSRLIKALLQAMTLERGTALITVLSLPSLDPSHLSTKPLPLPYAHFHSDKVAALLGEVGCLLGCRGDLHVLVDYILDELRLHSDLQCEQLLLLSHILAGGGCKGCGHDEAPPTHISRDELYAVVDGVVAQLVTADMWLQPRNISGGEPLNSDLLSFLLINVIFTGVHVLEANFDPLLQQLVYYLMEKLSSSNMGVANAAMATLEAICIHCGYQDVSKLIAGNADYLVHSISVRLRQASRGQTGHSEAIQVLGVVLQHGEESVCGMVRVTVSELLLSLDTRQLDPSLVWDGLRTLAHSCKCWLSSRTVPEPVAKATGVENSDTGREKLVKGNTASVGAAEGVGMRGVVKKSVEEEEGEAGEDGVRGSVGIQAIADFFQQYHKDKEAREEGGAQERGREGGGAQEGEDEDYSGKRVLSAAEQLSVDIMQRCVHHMAHHTPRVRLVVMETLQHCMEALKHDKGTLYPEVHGVWQPLLPRLTDHAPPVARGAWQVLLTMTTVCGDFVRKRVLEKVWPILINSLRTLTPASANAESLYQQSAKFKLQCVLLECLGGVACTLNLPMLQFEQGAVAASLYLSSEQAPPLQTLAVRTLTKMIEIDPDTIWLVLSQLAPPTPALATPPSPLLKPYKFPEQPDAAKYAKNVESLLSLTFHPQPPS